MFFPSATLANEVAIRCLLEPGDELLAAETCHLFFAEAGGPAIHAGAMCKPIATPTGLFTGAMVRESFRWSKGPHYPVSKMLSLENTTNIGGGIAWTREQWHDTLNTAKELGLRTHLDGSRLFNAVVKTGVSAKEFAAPCDFATVCFSKGLGCPTGAVLAFDKAHWPKVRRLKQLFGGAMRQSGMLAAACLYALDHHVERLADDHAHASLLAELLTGIPGIEVEASPMRTNMVFFSWKNEHLSADAFAQACLAQGLRFSQMSPDRFRAVTYLNICKEDIIKAAAIVKSLT